MRPAFEAASLPKIASPKPGIFRNDQSPPPLPQGMKVCEAHYECVRALAIYGTIANRAELKGTRERLSRHLRKVFLDGEHDPHHLTVHGLTYLQSLDRERGS